MKLLLLISIIMTQYLYALVSIAPVEVGKKAGMSVNIETGLETKRGNTVKDNYNTSFRFSYDDNTDYVVWSEVSRDYGKSNYKVDTNKAFAHLRLIHAISDDENLKYEVFTQLESDEFRQIETRTLGGAGVRYKLFDSIVKGTGFLGLHLFHENIRYTDPLVDPSEGNNRFNLYLAYTVTLSDKSTFSSSLYYQPIVNDFKDYLLLGELEVKLLINKSLYLKVSTSLSKDTKPSTGVDGRDFVQRTTFVFSF